MTHLLGCKVINWYACQKIFVTATLMRFVLDVVYDLYSGVPYEQI